MSEQAYPKIIVITPVRNEAWGGTLVLELKRL